MQNVKTIKQLLCLPIKPIFPYLRIALIKSGLIEQPASRQPFALGHLRDDVPVQVFRDELRSLHFFAEKMAFVDPDEILGMRLLDPKDPTYQYHVRVFRDGEVRGHHEKTPEDFPIDHFREVGFGPRYDEFMTMFGRWLKPAVTPAVSNPGKQYRTMPTPYLGPVRVAERGVAR